MIKPHLTFPGIAIKTIITHSVTYFLIGWLAYTFFSHVSLPGGGGSYSFDASDHRPVRDVRHSPPGGPTACSSASSSGFCVSPSLAERMPVVLIWVTWWCWVSWAHLDRFRVHLEGIIFTYSTDAWPLIQLAGDPVAVPVPLVDSLLLGYASPEDLVYLDHGRCLYVHYHSHHARADIDHIIELQDRCSN